MKPSLPKAVETPRIGPQPDQVNIRGVLLFCAALAALLIVIQPLVGIMLHSYRESRPPETVTAQSVSPGDSEQWHDPPADLATVRREENAHLNHRGWVDRSHGIAQIPIEQAMQLIAQRAATQSAPAQEAGHAAGSQP